MHCFKHCCAFARALRGCPLISLRACRKMSIYDTVAFLWASEQKLLDLYAAALRLLDKKIFMEKLRPLSAGGGI